MSEPSATYRGGESGRWFTPGRFSLLLLALICASYPEVFTGSATFFHRDFALFGYPFAAYHREHFWRGELPLWSPLNYCGLPYLGQWNTLTLYPLSIFYLIFPLSWSLGVFCLFHLFLAGLGMRMLAYQWTRSEFAAALAGLVYPFSALMLNSLMWPNNCAAMGLLPWVVWSVERAWTQGGRAVLFAVLAGTMQMLTGAPEVILFTWLLVTALWLNATCRSTPKLGESSNPLDHGDADAVLNANPAAPVARHQIAWRLIANIALIAGLSAVQLLPFFDLLHHSQRASGFSEVDSAMPRWGIANLFVPLFRMVPTPSGVYCQPWQYWIPSYYLGIGVAGMVMLCAIASRPFNRRLLILFSFFVFGLVLALGDAGGLYPLFCKFFPPLRVMRFPIKFILLPVIAAPLIAAICIADFEKTATNRSSEWRRRIGLTWAVCVILVAGIILVACTRPMERISAATTVVSGLSRIGWLTLILAFLVWANRTAVVRRKTLLQLAILLWLWLDVMTMGPRPNPTVSRWVYEPQLLQRHGQLTPFPKPGDARVMLSVEAELRLNNTTLSNASDQVVFSRLGLQGNANLIDQVPVVGGLYSLYLGGISEVLDVVYSPSNSPMGLIDFIGVSHINTPGRITERIYRPSHLPWVTAGQIPIFTNSAATLDAMGRPEFDPRQIVFLPPEAKEMIAVENHSTPELTIREFANQRVRLDFVSREPALVVIAQAYHHNWQASIDGTPAPLLRANHAFQAVQVPAGRHAVSLVYRDRAFQAGVAISVGTLGICVLFALRCTWRNKPCPTPPS